MAAAPKWKVFDSHGKYQASCHEIEGAACLVGFYGDGATIRAGHSRAQTVWTQGIDGNAYESYDAVATTVYDREATRKAEIARFFGGEQ